MTTTLPLHMAELAHFHTPTSPEAQIFHHIRARFISRNPITRAELARSLELSQPSVSRITTKLVAAGMIEENTSSLTNSSDTSTGRPSATLLPAGRHITACGLHIGTHFTLITLFDATGRSISEDTLNLHLPELDSAHEAIEAIAHRIRTLLSDASRSCIDFLGIALSTHVPQDGRITSLSYGWENVPVADILSENLHRLGVSIIHPTLSLSTGVSAMAGHELSVTPLERNTEFPSTLFFYAREVAEHAWILNNAVFRPHTGSSFLMTSSIASLPSDPSLLSNAAVLAQAAQHKIMASSLQDLVHIAERNPAARNILNERAQLFSSVINHAIQAVDPQKIVLAGESFAEDPHSVALIARAITQSHGGEQRSISIKQGPWHAFREAARAVSLHQLWQAPLMYTRTSKAT